MTRSGCLTSQVSRSSGPTLWEGVGQTKVFLTAPYISGDMRLRKGRGEGRCMWSRLQIGEKQDQRVQYYVINYWTRTRSALSWWFSFSLIVTSRRPWFLQVFDPLNCLPEWVMVWCSIVLSDSRWQIQDRHIVAYPDTSVRKPWFLTPPGRSENRVHTWEHYLLLICLNCPQVRFKKTTQVSKVLKSINHQLS
jgi:hypothetical protein